MHASWKGFLEQAGARFGTHGVDGFGDALAEAQAAAEGDVVADLSHFSLLRIGGADATNFLQGQFSNDVRRVTDEASQLNSYCSPKGRMLATFRLFRRGDDFYLLTPAELIESVATRLRKFVLMSKVTIDDVSDEVARIGISGTAAETKLRDHVGDLPDAADTVSHNGDLSILHVPGPQPRYLVVGTDEAVRGVWEAVAGAATPVGADAWGLLDVRAGLPSVYTDTVEAFVPQMANMQLVGGVSFRKGCYPGQEIVARMQYLGQLKRRMYLAHAETDERPLPGTPIHADGSESGQGTGKVVDARPAPNGGYDLLAVIVIDKAENATVHLRDAAGPVLAIRPLPYPFEAPDEIQA